MSASAQPQGIIGYVAGSNAENQRERIVTALSRTGFTAIDIVTESLTSSFSGRTGLATIYEYARRSNVDTIIVASRETLFNDLMTWERWRKDMAHRHRVRVVTLEEAE